MPQNTKKVSNKGPSTAFQKPIEEIDPFDIPLEVYHQLTSEEYYTLIEYLYTRYGSWIKDQFQQTQAVAWVLCDRQVVYTAENEYEPEDAVLDVLENRYQKPCYVIAKPPMIEECPRRHIRREDYYPTIIVYIGSSEWTEDKLFEEGIAILCDLDTGNPTYTVLDDRICRQIDGIGRYRRTREHLGIIYVYYSRRMKVGIRDEQSGRCFQKLVEGVEGWTNSLRNPYRLANPHREGFAGRDLLLNLRVQVTFDPVRKVSRWNVM